MIDGRPQHIRPTNDVTSAAIAMPFVPGGLRRPVRVVGTPG